MLHPAARAAFLAPNPPAQREHPTAAFWGKPDAMPCLLARLIPRERPKENPRFPEKPSASPMLVATRTATANPALEVIPRFTLGSWRRQLPLLVTASRPLAGRWRSAQRSPSGCAPPSKCIAPLNTVSRIPELNESTGFPPWTGPGGTSGQQRPQHSPQRCV